MQGNNHTGADDRTAGLNVLGFVIDAWATSLQVFLHCRFGERFFGPQAPAVLVLIPIYMVGWPHDDLRPMLLYLPAYLFMCLVQRLEMGLRRLRGDPPVHSRYNGTPVFMKWFGRMSEISVKTVMEPLILFIFGVLVRSDNRPFGTYLMIGAICLLVQSYMGVTWMWMRATDMHDSMIEQHELAERFRGMRGDDC
jgi:hypothetical protein